MQIILTVDTSFHGMRFDCQWRGDLIIIFAVWLNFILYLFLVAAADVVCIFCTHVKHDDAQTKLHVQDSILVFDDSKKHRAFNNTSAEERIVLIIDMMRPPDMPLGTAVGGHTDELDGFMSYFKWERLYSNRGSRLLEHREPTNLSKLHIQFSTLFGYVCMFLLFTCTACNYIVDKFGIYLLL